MKTARVIFWLLLLSSVAFARPLAFPQDTFAFSNDTAMAYGIDERGQLQISQREHPAEYAHCCFLLSRSVLQFHRFARFAPEKPKLSREEYRRLIRNVCRYSAWRPEPKEKVVIPGFRDLHSFSIAYEGLLKESLGNWRLTYLRVGNWRMAVPHFRGGQFYVAQWLEKSLAEGRPRALYLSRFPHMNHVVIAYRAQSLAGKGTRFLVYDPNRPDVKSWVDFDASVRTFQFPRQWYFEGGAINVFRVYLSPLR